MSLVHEELRLVVGGGERRVCVRVAGELDVASAALLSEVLAAAVVSEVGDVDVEMSETTFCDSTGLTVLLAAERRLRRTGRQLRIVEASRSVRRLLALSGTHHLVGPPRNGRTELAPSTSGTASDDDRSPEAS
jgi:anti-anti-sigma factor